MTDNTEKAVTLYLKITAHDKGLDIALPGRTSHASVRQALELAGFRIDDDVVLVKMVDLIETTQALGEITQLARNLQKENATLKEEIEKGKTKLIITP